MNRTRCGERVCRRYGQEGRSSVRENPAVGAPSVSRSELPAPADSIARAATSAPGANTPQRSSGCSPPMRSANRVDVILSMASRNALLACTRRGCPRASAGDPLMSTRGLRQRCRRRPGTDGPTRFLMRSPTWTGSGRLRRRRMLRSTSTVRVMGRHAFMHVVYEPVARSRIPARAQVVVGAPGRSVDCPGAQRLLCRQPALWRQVTG